MGAPRLPDRPSPAARDRAGPRRVSRAVLFAILAGVSAATWTVCLKLASTKITPALGALVITAGALVINGGWQSVHSPSARLEPGDVVLAFTLALGMAEVGRHEL